jgi:sulfite exporter TauE/SafE
VTALAFNRIARKTNIVDPSQPKTSESTKIQKTFLLILTAALFGWGAYHAAGAYFGGFGGENLQHDFRRSLVVLACMSIFLVIWWLLMLSRKPDNSRTGQQQQTKNKE